MKAAMTVFAIAALCISAWAADNAAVAERQTTSLKPQAPSLETDAITIPQMLSYQGKLTDTFGLPVADTLYAIRFRLYALPTGGTQFWEENQNVRTTGGLFSVLLGSVTPIGSMPDAGAAYLGMAVAGGAELTPRLRIASAAYAYLSGRAANADLLQGRDTATFSRSTHNHDATYVNEGQANSVTGAMLVDGTVKTADVGDTAVTMAKLAQAGATTGEVIKWTGSIWEPSPDNTGGGSGVTNVYQDTGITCVPNPITSTGNVKLNLTYSDGRYVNEGQANSVTGAMITDGQVSSADIRDTTVTTAKLKDGAVTSAKILDANVTSADIRDTTVNTADLKDAAVTAPKLNQMGASSGQVMKWTGSAWAPRNDSVGGGTGDNAWVRGTPDSVLFTIRQLGISRGGSNNALLGTARQTHVNFGVDCTTGTSGFGYLNCVVTGGQYNAATGDGASVAGGTSNKARGPFSFVGGGGANLAGGAGATVAGGVYDSAIGCYSSVGGGCYNTAGHDAGDTAAVIAGGAHNRIENQSVSTAFATIGGGRGNSVHANLATVAGGEDNTVSATGGFVGGGELNTVNGTDAVVAGGVSNSAGGMRAFIGAGYGNSASIQYTVVGGGENNAASGAYSVVGGGCSDSVVGFYGAALSGYSNRVGGVWTDSASVIAGGWDNDITGRYSTIGGGHHNGILCSYATIAGGDSNSLEGGTCGAIGGGRADSVRSLYGVVGGGYSNYAGDAAADTAVVIAGGWNNSATTKFNTIGGGYQNTTSEYYATIAGGLGNTASGPQASVGGGGNNVAGGYYAAIAGGRDNAASGTASAVAGGRYDTCQADYSLLSGYNVRARASADYTLAFGENCSTSTPRAVVFYHSGAPTKLGVGVQTPTHNIDVQGGAYCNGTNWVNGSSRKLKTDIRALTPAQVRAALEELSRVQVVNYRYKSEAGGEQHIGLIAEDAPELLATPERDGINTADADGVLIAAVQALYEQSQIQQAEIEQLKAELEQQKR